MFLPAQLSRKDPPRKQGPMSLRKLRRTLRSSRGSNKYGPPRLRKISDLQWVTREEAESTYPEFGAIDGLWPLLRSMTARKLGLAEAELAKNSRFREDLSADSLDLVELTMEIEEVLQIEVPDDQLSTISTVEDALEFLDAHLKRAGRKIPAAALRKVSGGESPSASRASGTEIEDVRRSRGEDGEVILNLWYVTDGYVISSLRSKAYIASGTDQEKLSFLQKRANSDFPDAEVHPVPDSMKAEIKLVGESGIASVGRECTHQMLEMMGGYLALFRDVVEAIPSHGFRFDTSQAMMCITGLVKGTDGALAVQIDKQTPL